VAVPRVCACVALIDGRHAGVLYLLSEFERNARRRPSALTAAGLAVLKATPVYELIKQFQDLSPSASSDKANGSGKPADSPKR
jgi:hypothetical protein